MKICFLLLRILTGLTSVGGILIMLAIILLRSLPGFAKHLAKVIAYLAQAFTSAFTKGTTPDDPSWVVGPAQVGLIILFVAMVVSVFLPGAKLLLHVIAGLCAVVLLWYGWMEMCADVKLEIFCLPAVVVWLVYYLMCVFWFGRQTPVVVAG